jgi:hypothetical protein
LNFIFSIEFFFEFFAFFWTIFFNFFIIFIFFPFAKEHFFPYLLVISLIFL